MLNETKVVIFTDLDGTLLDYGSYSFADALPALRLIKKWSIPLIICSSKTAAEIGLYRRRLENHHPFISENGGGIFVPKGYFGFQLADWLNAIDDASIRLESDEEYEFLRLGARYEELRKALEILNRSGFSLRGFGDMSADEVSALTGLPLPEAVLAKQREFDEPFVVDGGPNKPERIAEAIERLGFHCVTGRIKHIVGSSDKGKAVSLLKSMYRTASKALTTIGVGDAPNDLPMLQAVDHPILVQQPDGSYHGDLIIQGLVRAEGKGPAGWNSAIMDLLTRWSLSDPKGLAL